jgi:gluconokinase
MASGLPLTDAHREGWLDAIGVELSEAARMGAGAVAACSALKRSYRDRLRRFCPDLVFIHLAIDRETARKRVGGRKAHFMPATLVDSQFADLEPPMDGEAALTLDGTRPIPELVAAAAEFLNASKTA